MWQKIFIAALTLSRVNRFWLWDKFARERIIELMDQHGLVDFLTCNYLTELFGPQDLVLCRYYDESEFVKSNQTFENNFSFILMNICSLSNHYAELLCITLCMFENESIFLKFTYYQNILLVVAYTVTQMLNILFMTWGFSRHNTWWNLGNIGWRYEYRYHQVWYWGN